MSIKSRGGGAPLCDPRPPRVGRYELGETLGAGAMGVVYRARDPELDRAVAIKLVRTDGADEISRARLLREAQSMARLRHRNVVPIFDVGLARGAVFIAMPLLEGGTLRSWLRAGPHRLSDILDRFAAAGQGLAAAHKAGLVHRDFKPDNVLLGGDGDVQVADFGLARFADRAEADPVCSAATDGDGLTRTGDVLGTPAYMAPEQLRGRPSDARADQFSFCVALWEAVYDQRPFPQPPAGDQDPLGLRHDAIIAGPVLPPVRRDRPAWIAQLLSRGLAVDPDRRWPTMQALLDAIAAGRAPLRWPRWSLAGLGVVAAAIAAVILGLPASATRITEDGAHRSSPGPEPAIEPWITDYADLRAAAPSPDGRQIAAVIGHRFVLRPLTSGPEREIIPDGVSDGYEVLSWSPDSTRVLVGLTAAVPGTYETALVDVRSGTWSRLASLGVATFLSDTEIALSSPRQHSVTIAALADRAAPAQPPAQAPVQARIQTVASTTCEVPGDYTFLTHVIGLPDRAIVVATEFGGHQGLIFLDRSCRVRARFPRSPPSGFASFVTRTLRGTGAAEDKQRLGGVALTDHGTVVTVVHGSGRSDIVEFDGTGKEIARRGVVGEVKEIIGRRGGVDYLVAFAPRSRLERFDRAGLTTLYTRAGWTTFALAPHCDALAWIELDNFPQGHGALRVAPLSSCDDGAVRQAIQSRPRPLLASAVAIGWAPDSEHLAVTIDDRDEPAIRIIDRAGGILGSLPLAPIERTARPVWLDDHRVAAQTSNRLTYRWYNLVNNDDDDVGDRRHGSTYALVRSPSDGTLAMWRNGPPGAITAQTEHLWLIPPGGEPRPLHLASSANGYLIPSWSNTGELLVRSSNTGLVSRVALDTGMLTPVVQMAPVPIEIVTDEHLQPMRGGGFLSSEIDPGLYLATAPGAAMP
jgi:hypothetical protein